MKNNENNIIRDIEYVKTILNYSDEDLAEFFDISRMTLSRWKRNDFKANKDSLEKIYNRIYTRGIYLNSLKEEMYKSLENKDTLILFHGAKKDLIGKPSIKYSEGKKDFGKGFYLGESVRQSISFVSVYDNPSLHVFKFNKRNVKIKEFSVSRDWMLLIAYYRGKIEEYKNSIKLQKLIKELEDVDVIIAPIADNTMYSILSNFIDGTITDEQCLNALSANRLGKQYVFLNDKIINNNLQLLDKCYICEEEKRDINTQTIKDTKTGKAKVKLALREYAGKGKYIEEILK